MKKTYLKILFTSLSFFALSATFAQVDSSNAVTTDSANVSVPQPGPMATDTTSVNQNPSTNQNPSGADSTSADQPKAVKKEE